VVSSTLMVVRRSWSAFGVSLFKAENHPGQTLIFVAEDILAIFVTAYCSRCQLHDGIRLRQATMLRGYRRD